MTVRDASAEANAAGGAAEFAWSAFKAGDCDGAVGATEERCGECAEEGSGLEMATVGKVGCGADCAGGFAGAAVGAGAGGVGGNSVVLYR